MAKTNLSKSPKGKEGSRKPPSTGKASTQRSKSQGKRTPPKQVKTKPGSQQVHKRKKQRVYTDKELGLPAVNMITPASVQKTRGKKAGKVYIDDQVLNPHS